MAVDALQVSFLDPMVKGHRKGHLDLWVTVEAKPGAIDLLDFFRAAHAMKGLRIPVRMAGIAGDLLKTIEPYDALLVRSATKVTAEVIAAGKNLRVIGRAGTGVDNIDARAATRRGIIVMNTPGGNTVSAAEHTVSMMLSLARNIPQAHMSLHAGEWER
jgi:phosphoglycerate dehydrogenase-like enzyme